MPSHALIDAASRKLGIAVAKRLREDPSQLEVGLRNLARWLSGEVSASRRAACEEWQEILAEGDLEKISAVLEAIRRSAGGCGRIRLSPESSAPKKSGRSRRRLAMRLRELEHIIRAAASIVDARDIVVIGSQAILGQFPDAGEEFLASMDADIFPRDDPAAADLIDGSIGELSPFHQTFGYYAHGVSESTAWLPRGWKDRLVRVASENTGGGVGWCLEAHDLAVSKLAAGREKDLEFVRAMLRKNLIRGEIMGDRLDATELDDECRTGSEIRLRSMLDG